MIDFNRPALVGNELNYIQDAVAQGMLCGDGKYTKLCSQWMKDRFQVNQVFLTTSCTHALEMAAFLCDIQPGDEVIMPSYTFVSTADAFVLRGAKIVFVDIRPDTMNINEELIEEAITDKTRAIVPVHYAGVSCEMNKIMALAEKYNLKVVEDAAQGVEAYYHGKALGTIGDFGCYSFHETKNYTMGEGGALVFQKNEYQEKAEILREKGTDRSKFFRGQVDKYRWIDYGSSYLPSEMNAAYLYAQLEECEKINQKRHQIYDTYHESLRDLEEQGKIQRPFVPEGCVHNAHMYYIKVKDLSVRSRLIAYLKEKGICTAFHYVPLHSSPAGEKFGRFSGEDVYTTKESERLYVFQCFIIFPCPMWIILQNLSISLNFKAGLWRLKNDKRNMSGSCHKCSSDPDVLCDSTGSNRKYRHTGNRKHRQYSELAKGSGEYRGRDSSTDGCRYRSCPL